MEFQELSLPKLKCSGCELYLSVGPVSTNTGSHFFCGRCLLRATVVKIYETLAEKFLFPCRYESFGCKRLIGWGFVEDHERTCIKKPAPCPAVSNNCDWNGSMEDLRLHILQTHTTECMEGKSIPFMLLDIVKRYMLVNIKGDWCVVHINFRRETQVLELDVSQLEEIICSHQPKYEICLYFFEIHKNISMAAVDLKPYNLLNHDSIRHTNIIDISVFNLDWNAPTPPLVLLEIKIVERGRKSNPLMCCHCNSRLYAAQVGVCQMGCHYCNSCVSKVGNCLRCHTVISSMSVSIYKCKNEAAGCFFRGSPDQVQEHEATCDFYVCPLKTSEGCGWIGDYRDVVSHCIADHYYDNIVSGGVEGNFDVLWNSGTFRMLHYKQLFFRLGVHVSDEELAVAIQLVGPARNAAQYFYELVLISCTNTHRKIRMRSCCQKLTDEKSAFDNCVKVQNSLIRSVEKDLSNVEFLIQFVNREMFAI